MMASKEMYNIPALAALNARQMYVFPEAGRPHILIRYGLATAVTPFNACLTAARISRLMDSRSTSGGKMLPNVVYGAKILLMTDCMI